VSSHLEPPPPDDEDPFAPLQGIDDEGPAEAGTFLGALGQMAAAALVVLAVLALFIAGAVVFRWTFR
jgi:hypothetical protein